MFESKSHIQKNFYYSYVYEKVKLTYDDRNPDNATFVNGNWERQEDAFCQAGNNFYLDQMAVLGYMFIKDLKSLHLKFMHFSECFYTEILKS